LEISFEHDILQHQVGLRGIEAISFQIKNKGSSHFLYQTSIYNIVSSHYAAFPTFHLLGRENLPFFFIKRMMLEIGTTENSYA